MYFHSNKHLVRNQKTKSSNPNLINFAKITSRMRCKYHYLELKMNLRQIEALMSESLQFSRILSRNFIDSDQERRVCSSSREILRKSWLYVERERESCGLGERVVRERETDVIERAVRCQTNVSTCLPIVFSDDVLGERGSITNSIF